MANLKVALLLRAKTTNGNRPYLNPVMAGNGKIRPLWAVYKNQPTHFPDGIYNLRYKQGKRLVFARTGSDLAVAQIELRRLITFFHPPSQVRVIEQNLLDHVNGISKICLALGELQLFQFLAEVFNRKWLIRMNDQLP